MNNQEYHSASAKEKSLNHNAVKGSTEALLEVFCYAQQLLSNLQNNQFRGDTDNGLTELELLRRENALLKKELSSLDRMIKEKL